MYSNNLLTIFVAITAVAFLGQAVGVLLIYRRISQATERMVKLTGEVREKVSTVTENIVELAKTFKPIGEHLQAISANAVSMSNTIRARTEDLDYFLGGTVEIFRGQVNHLNEFLAMTTLRLEDTANRVQRGIIAPINEITALIKGLRAGVAFLFSRWPGNNVRRPPAPDDEMFI
ncbi:MAG: hypothetical protein HYR55_10840 [Acidobacteria bacterium]|nr:hypothetical protein [Acidobacteriota bacterium]MBI3655652.1 hypothetical protein [Acidobacteriota bacterium]